MKVYLTEKQFKDYCRYMLKEEAQVIKYCVGSFGEDNESVLNAVREKFGFGEYDSGIENGSVCVYVEKDRTNDSYAYDLVDAVKKFAKSLNGYQMVAESKKAD